MVDVSDPGKLQAWLETQPQQVSVLIAARAAARVLPLIGFGALQTGKRADRYRAEVILAVFRANAVSRLESTWPSRANEHLAAVARAVSRVVSRAANQVAIRVAASADISVAIAAAPSGPAVAEGVTFVSSNAAGATAEAAQFAADALMAAAVAADAFAQVWAAIQADVDMLLEGKDGTRVEENDTETFNRLARQPLWHMMRIPDAIMSAHRMLERRLLNANENWGVWLEWYDRQSHGDSSPFEWYWAFVDWPEEDWKQGPAHINGLIKHRLLSLDFPSPEILVQASEKPDGIDMALEVLPPSPEDLPPQTTTTLRYGPREDLRVGPLPETDADRLALAPAQRIQYDETREKLEDLKAKGANALGSQLDTVLGRALDVMPPEMGDANLHRVWSRMNTLRTLADKHDAAMKAAEGQKVPEPHPDRLEPSVAIDLKDVVGTYNNLAFTDPGLRQKDENAPGPQERVAAAEELKAGLETSKAAAADPRITTEEAKADIEAIPDNLKEPATNLNEAQAQVQARDTQRNFVAGLLASVIGAWRVLEDAQKGKYGETNKNLATGALKAIGAGIVKGVYEYREPIISTLANSIAIIEFFVANTNLLTIYAALAYQSGNSIRVFDWIKLKIDQAKEIADKKSP